jgi:hypothetical protein
MDKLFIDLGENKIKLIRNPVPYYWILFFFYLLSATFILLDTIFIRKHFLGYILFLFIMLNAVLLYARIKGWMYTDQFVRINSREISWKTSVDYFRRNIRWSSIREIEIRYSAIVFILSNGSESRLDIIDLHAGQSHDLVQQVKARAAKFGIVMN